jgi:D-alanine-D-alanine ligase
LEKNLALKDYGKVAVLLGGESNEREISLQSGQAVLTSLLQSKVNAFGLDPKFELLSKLAECSRVFICLHGKDGEDGKIQSYLDDIKIPYTGSGFHASKLGMDKLLSKNIWKKLKINTPNFVRLEEGMTYDEVCKNLGSSFFIKAANSGSSIGISKVTKPQQYQAAFESACKVDNTVIAEMMIFGEEFTLPILDSSPLSIVEIRPKTDFYDYEAKYHRDDTEFICPAKLDKVLVDKINQLGMKAFNALGCSGWGRVDFMINNQNEVFIIEVNTIPGMTSHSLVPMSAKQSGLSFDSLVLKVLDTAYA